MHIEPGIVDGAKMALGYATAAGAGTYTVKAAVDTVRESNFASLAARATVATGLVFTFFQILPHYPVGVSEVHFILGSTLFLILGAAPAALGLAIGFGAPTLVKDIVSGVFFLLDAAFRLGEFIVVGTTMGIVEKISVRSIQLRSDLRALHTILNGSTSHLLNNSQAWGP